MYSKLFPKEEQLQNAQEEQGVQSRILAYTPELLIMII